MEWNKLIPKRVTTNEEKEEYTGFTLYWNGVTPNINEEVIISNGKTVWTDTWIQFCDGVAFESYVEEIDIPIYWMSFPELPKENIE